MVIDVIIASYFGNNLLVFLFLGCNYFILCV
jgi:hypothetical protein